MSPLITPISVSKLVMLRIPLFYAHQIHNSIYPWMAPHVRPLKCTHLAHSPNHPRWADSINLIQVTPPSFPERITCRNYNGYTNLVLRKRFPPAGCGACSAGSNTCQGVPCQLALNLVFNSFNLKHRKRIWLSFVVIQMSLMSSRSKGLKNYAYKTLLNEKIKHTQD